MNYRDCIRTGGILLALVVNASCSGQKYKLLSPDELKNRDGWYDFGEFLYRGELRKGKPAGPGELYYPASGIRVSGGFHQGAAHGMVTIVARGYGTLRGDMTMGVLSRGKAELDNGDVYAGGFDKWRFHGQGMLIRANNTRYQGAFAAGLPNGQGMSYDPSTGTLLEATFKNGSPNGRGLRERNGAAEAVHFQDGRDITEQERNDRAAAPIVKRAEDNLRAKQQAEAAQQKEADSWGKTADWLADRVSPSGIRDFGKECSCWFRVEINTADGRVEIWEQTCLPLYSTKLSPDEQREIERAHGEKYRVCNSWQKDINNPNIRQEIANLEERHRQAMASFAEARRAREEAAAALARTKEEIRRRQHAEVQQRVAAFKAEEDRLARQRMTELAQRCSVRPCYCPVILKNTPKNAVSCQ